MTRRRGVGLGLLALLLVGVLLPPLVWSEEDIKDSITKRLSKALGREVVIEGELDIDARWPLRVEFSELRIANLPEREPQWMLTVPRGLIRVDPLSLLFGRLKLPLIEAHGAELHLQRDAQGQGNWHFRRGDPKQPSSSGDSQGKGPRFGRLRIYDSTVHVQDAQREVDIRAQVRTAAPAEAELDAPEPGVEDGLRIEAQGRIQGRKFVASAQGDPPPVGNDRDGRYSLQAQARVGDTEARIEGHVNEPLRLRGLDLALTLSGPDLAELALLTTLPFPPTPPYEISGQVEHEGRTWRLADFAGRIGDSDLRGQFSVERGGDKPMLRANLRADLLDLDDLAPLLGGTPATGEGETASPEQRAAAQAEAEDDRVLPDQAAVRVDRLQKVNAEVDFEAQRVEARLPIDDLVFKASLRDGQLQVDPFRFGLAGGDLDGKLGIDSQAVPPTWRYRLDVESLDLRRLAQLPKTMREASGTVSGAVAIDTRGATIASALAQADGQGHIALRNGQLSGLLVEILGMDAAEALGLVLTEDQTVPVRCGGTRFVINQGVLESELLLLDTTDTHIHGGLRVDFARERFRLDLDAEPKDSSLFSARAPLKVEGRFADFTVRPDFESLSGRVALGALAGALLGPVGALAAFIEPGEGEDADCPAVMQALREGKDAAQ